MTDISERVDALRRWKCTSYCLCGSRKGHFEAHDDGAWVLYTDALAEIDRLCAEVERLTQERDDAEQRVRDIDALWHGQRDVIAERDQLRAEVERLTRERDEARKPPHCINCHCEESAKGMVDLSDYLDLHRGLMAVVYESKSHAEAVLFSERALRHAESEHVISEAASSAVASDPYADQNRALVAEIAARRGITLGHLREDGGCELAQIMRRLDAAEAEIDRLRAEVSRLTQEDAAARSDIEMLIKSRDVFLQEVEELRAEIERLTHPAGAPADDTML